ncbi:MAG: ABC transporter substrate-binding protein, partial [Acidimicrobiales bacterium]|jgi:branched-chain amino acid transport system substrate-binding protein
MSPLHLTRLVTRVAVVCASLALAAVGLTAATAAAAGTATPNVTGVTGTSITIGATVPLTGIASPGYNEVAKAAAAVFNWVNNHGKVNGRKILYDLVDDCYGTPGFGCKGNPDVHADTVTLVTKDHVFATVGSLGTPTQAPERAYLKSVDTPQLMVNSGSIDWNCVGGSGTPSSDCNGTTYPGLTGWQPSYTTESKILAKYIKANYAGKKVCFLGQSDDFGHNGYLGLTYGGIHPVVTRFYSVDALVVSGAASITPYIESFQSAGCSVVYLDTIPGATAAALGNAEALSYKPQWVISSVGSDPTTVATELGSTPDSEPGAISFAYLATTNGFTDPWISWTYKVLEAAPGLFPGFKSTSVLNGNEAYGVAWGVAFVEALRAAGRNFTQASFLHILTTMKFETPAITPLQYSATNHQGLIAGFVDKIKSKTATEPAPGKDGNKTVWVTKSTSASPVTSTTVLSLTVPSWLK